MSEIKQIQDNIKIMQDSQVKIFEKSVLREVCKILLSIVMGIAQFTKSKFYSISVLAYANYEFF